MTQHDLIDMEIMEFATLAMNSSVSEIKVMTDALRIGLAEIQMTYYQLKVDTYDHKRNDYNEDDWNKFCDTLAQLGGLYAKINYKLDILAHYSYEKMPDCFKK